MASKEEVVSILNDLIQTCRDSHEAFERAADNVHRVDLKTPLNELSHQQAIFAGELEDQVRSLGGEPAKRGHLGSLLERGLGEIGSRFKEKDDPAILAECQKVADDSLRHYQHALNEDLPADVRMIVQRHFQAVQAALSQLRTMEIARRA
jgi:uncharacterized protein (TIGR02284 family)